MPHSVSEKRDTIFGKTGMLCFQLDVNERTFLLGTFSKQQQAVCVMSHEKQQGGIAFPVCGGLWLSATALSTRLPAQTQMITS